MQSRFNTSIAIFPINLQRRTRRVARQSAVAVVALSVALGVAACSGDQAAPQGSLGYVEGFLGGVVADEPRAALIGRDILSVGGSAADAATAMYFTLAVTLPSRAGLGGGGVCLAFDAVSGTTQALDFTAQAPTTIVPSADRPSAVPANPRGFFALQARHGRLQWREVVASAEQLARLGHPVSRAFARDLASVGPALLVDEGARVMFGSDTGQMVREGDKIKELDLAATLGLIRARGVGPFYAGPYAANLVNAVNRVGGSLSIESLRNYAPVWRDTVRVEIGNEIAHFAPPPAAASSQAAVMLAMMIEDGGFDGNTEGGQVGLLAEVSLRSFSDRETWLNARAQGTLTAKELTSPDRLEGVLRGMRPEGRTPVAALVPSPRDRHENPSATAFSAVDGMGNAVSCVVTMNAAFGTGRVAPGSGILLAAAPSTDGRGPIGLAPMLVANEHSREFRFAAGASGGVAAPAALAGVAARVLLDNQGLEAAVTAPRVHLSGDPDVTYHEPALTAGAVAALSAAGHRLATTPTIGLVNAISCPDGLPTQPNTCAMAVDPRGQGLASGSMR